MLRLLALLAGLVLLALLVFARRGASPEASARAPSGGGEALAADPGVPQTEQPLESVDEQTDLRRESRPDAFPRVFGHLQCAGDPSGGKVRLFFEDHHSSALSAEDSHARTVDEDERNRLCQARVATVRRDGWWYVDLPGKSWLVRAEFIPAVQLWDMPPALAAALLDDPSLEQPRPRRGRNEGRGFVARRDAIPSSQPIERPIEQGKLELTLAVETGLVAQGVVLDTATQAPVAGAQVALKSMRAPCLVTETQADGSFRLAGIDAQDLRPQNGTLIFVVQSAGRVTAQRETPWEDGQQGIVAFRVFLQPKGR